MSSIKGSHRKMDILDRLDKITKVPSKKSSVEYFSMSIDEIVEKFAYIDEIEKQKILNRLDKITIEKIKILQEGGIIK